jgi:hypothetical protein
MFTASFPWKKLLQVFVHRMVMRSCRARLAALLMMPALALGFDSLARADATLGGFRTICTLHPYNDGQRTPTITGIAFDDQANPWVLDGLSWQMQRLDKNAGTVLQTYTPTSTTSYNDSLAWAASNGAFYTNADRNSLYSMNINLDTRTHIGSSSQYQSFNFLDMAFDPSGRLWLATDRNRGELWSVNTATGVPTFERAITGLGVDQQLHALAIDTSGQFYVACSSSWPNGNDCIYNVNPQSGATSLLTYWPDSTTGAFIDSFTIDPTTGRCFGIREVRSESPYGYYFVELAGVSEPSAMALLGGGVIGLGAHVWRTRRSASKER